MNFKYINKLILILILVLVYSCEKLENLTKKEKINTSQIANNVTFENSEILSLRNDFKTNNNLLDFYSNNFSNNFSINDRILKKYTINNFSTDYNGNNPIKIYLLEDFIYGVDFKGNFNIYDIQNGKLLNSISLENINNINNEYISIPTSITKYYSSFIIAFKSGKIIMINKNGKLVWEFVYDEILTTPLKIINENIIVLYGDTIKSISIKNGSLNWSETYDGSSIYQIKGGIIKVFANYLYFILPNSIVGEFDTIFKDKNFTNFTNIKFKNSLNNSNDDIHIFDHNVIYFDEGSTLYNYDIFLDKFILYDFKIENVSSFKFFNNSLIVQNNNKIEAYNLKNGNIFWSFNLDKIISQKNKIISVQSFNNKLHVFFDNGKVIIIQKNEIINVINLKLKNINLLYFQNDKLLVSLENGKTVLFQQ